MKFIKNIAVLALVTILTFSLAACGAGNTDNATGSESATTTESRSEVSKAETTDTTDASATSDVSSTDTQEPVASANKVLVVYFSATGTTKSVAEAIKSEIGADIFEIVPEIPYTADDLNYGNSASRTSKEQNDSSARPAMDGSMPSLEQYDTIFLGYPIWWGQAPKILYTFVEGCDLTGKTIIPFCTSGSSSIGSSATNLSKSASGANWLDGQRLTESSVTSWLNELKY